MGAAASVQSVNAWGADEVAAYLESKELGAHVAAFREAGITGESLVALDDARLAELGVADDAARAQLASDLEALRANAAAPAAAAAADEEPLPERTHAYTKLVNSGPKGCGKSALFGRLVHELCSWAQEQAPALSQLATELGNDADPLAFHFDRTPEERRAKSTMHGRVVCGPMLSGGGSHHLLMWDTPGNRKHYRNLHRALHDNDAALVCVEAQDLNHDMWVDYLKKELVPRVADLATAGIPAFAIAITKMDVIEWSVPILQSIQLATKQVLQQVGVPESMYEFIPCSARTNEGIVQRSSEINGFRPLLEWASHISRKPVDAELFQGAFRMTVSHVWRVPGAGIVAGGITTQGNLRTGKQVHVHGKAVHATVNSIRGGTGEEEGAAFYDEYSTLALGEVPDFKLKPGMVLCASPPAPAPQLTHTINVLARCTKQLVEGERLLMRVCGQTAVVKVAMILVVETHGAPPQGSEAGGLTAPINSTARFVAVVKGDQEVLLARTGPYSRVQFLWDATKTPMKAQVKEITADVWPMSPAYIAAKAAAAEE